MNKAKTFLDKMYEVIQANENTLLSERQQFLITNDELPEKDRISMSYFEFLKSESQSSPKSITNSPQFTEEERKHYLHILELGRAKQIQNLTKGAMDDTARNAYPYLRILEMKNPKFRNGGGNIQIGTGNITLQIEGANQSMIQAIDVDYIEVDEQPKQLITKKDNDDE